MNCDLDFAELLPDLEENRHLQPLTTEELFSSITNQIPSSTLKHAMWAKNTFDDWVRMRNKRILNSHSSSLMFLSEEGDATLSTMSQGSLNAALKFFFFEVRKKNGDMYPSNTLRSLLVGINYWLNVNNKPWKLFSDQEFHEARRSLDSAMKESSQKGTNQKTKRASPITKEQEESLWERNYLGSDNPKKLNRTMIYLLSINCGLRGGREIRQLSFGENSDLNLKTLPNGKTIIEYTDSYSKTFKHGLKQHHIEPKIVQVWPADNYERCPVKLYKKMISLRPTNCTTNALFLQPVANYTSTKWYNNTPMGHNVISLSFRSLMEAAGEDGNFTNQSGRRTTVTRIFEATGDKQLARKITGHRSDCVDIYNEIGEKRLKLASNILTNSKGESSDIATTSHMNQITDIAASQMTVQCTSTIVDSSKIAGICQQLDMKPKKLTIQNADGSRVVMDF